MERTFTCLARWLCCVWIFLWAAGGLAADLGPMPTTNRLPIYLMFMTPRPTNAQLPSMGELEGRMALEYSSVNLEHTGSQWEVLMDMEMAVLDLSLTYGVSERLALKLDVPVVSMADGTLDRFLDNYHDALGVPDYGREDRPRDTFGYQATRDGLGWFDGRTGTWEPTSVTLSALVALPSSADGRRFRSNALLLSLKLPVGDDKLGLSSGAIDAGIFLPVQWSGSPWSFYIMPGIAVIGDPEGGAAEVAARDSYSLFTGAAYDLNQQLRLLAQLQFMTSPIESTGSSKLDNGALEISFGFQHRLGRRWALEFAFSEDITQAAPDFNLRLGLIHASGSLDD